MDLIRKKLNIIILTHLHCYCTTVVEGRYKLQLRQNFNPKIGNEESDKTQRFVILDKIK